MRAELAAAHRDLAASRSSLQDATAAAEIQLQQASVESQEHISQLKTALRRAEEALTLSRTQLAEVQEQLAAAESRQSEPSRPVNAAPGREEDQLSLLAELQAARDASVGAMVAQVEFYKDKLAEWRALIIALREEQARLQQHIKTLLVSRNRSALNMDYLKNVLVRYIQFERLGLESERDAMVAVLSTLMAFTPEDRAAVAIPRQQGWGWLGGAFTGAASLLSPQNKSFSAALAASGLPHVQAAHASEDGVGRDPASALQSKNMAHEGHGHYEAPVHEESHVVDGVHIDLRDLKPVKLTHEDLEIVPPKFK